MYSVFAYTLMKHPTLAYNINTVACNHYIAYVKYMYLSTSCIQGLKFSVFCASVNTYIGKVVSKNFSNSLWHVIWGCC